MKKNFNYNFFSILITYLITIFFLIIYFVFLEKKIPIPTCPIHKYLNIYCPACGCTRAIISLLKLDIISSIYYNPIILYSIISINIYLINESVKKILKKGLNIPYELIIKLGLVILLVNFIVKNLFNIEMIFIIMKLTII